MPRLYDHDFCPVIPPDVTLSGVLGRCPTRRAGLRWGDQWLTADELTMLEPADRAQRVHLFSFVPADYGARLVEKWEATTGYGAITSADEAEQYYRVAPAAPPLAERGEGLTTAPDLIHHHLLDTMQQRNLRQKDLAALFGVSAVTISYWLQGSEPDETGKVRGRPIPEQVILFVMRRIEEREPPTPEALATLTSRRPGRHRS